jgi:hypothetical protein
MWFCQKSSATIVARQHEKDCPTRLKMYGSYINQRFLVSIFYSRCEKFNFPLL